MMLLFVELGYYVVFVVVMDEMFKQNGLMNVIDIQVMLLVKLCEIFGVDVVLYLKVMQYGFVYQLVDSMMIVVVLVKFVDLKSGDVLWQGEGCVIGKEVGNNMSVNVFGIVGVFVQVVVKQVVYLLIDEVYDVVGLMSMWLLLVGLLNGLLYGLCLLKYGID